MTTDRDRPADEIEVEGLEVQSSIGVPDEERATPQRLLVDLRLIPSQGFDDLGDAIENTIDYYTLTRGVIALAAEGERRLIETLATDIARDLLASHPLDRVRVKVRKFILPDTEHVAVVVERQRDSEI